MANKDKVLEVRFSVSQHVQPVLFAALMEVAPRARADRARILMERGLWTEAHSAPAPAHGARPGMPAPPAVQAAAKDVALAPTESPRRTVTQSAAKKLF
ncbi:MAG: hypothetical protein E6Q76_07335 [Rhizobium sp.]|nr:MAG: hypothetical protein E6Q76_07335 [Rhizobium sp.]